MKIWIDITNTPHVNVLLPIIKHLEEKHSIIITARDFSETLPLLKKNNIEPIVLGSYMGKSRIKKIMGLIYRINQMRKEVPDFDVSMSLGGNYTATISRLRNKKSIIFSDNDISFKVPAYKFGTDFIFPEYFDSSKLSSKYNIQDSQIYKFNGFKEDIYIADFKPDIEFLSQVPFESFITIRPENLKASYVPKSSHSIVPFLFDKFKNENILFLPRYKEERQYARGYSNIFIPDNPLSGLDVCYYTKAMLTGAGTFAREAAILGTPAVSFFPGKKNLTVDQVMQDKGWEFKSRNVDEIHKYVITAKKRNNQIDRSKVVKSEVLNIINQIIDR